jgi:hypothetical protein
MKTVLSSAVQDALPAVVSNVRALVEQIEREGRAVEN